MIGFTRSSTFDEIHKTDIRLHSTGNVGCVVTLWSPSSATTFTPSSRRVVVLVTFSTLASCDESWRFDDRVDLTPDSLPTAEMTASGWRRFLIGDEWRTKLRLLRRLDGSEMFSFPGVSKTTFGTTVDSLLTFLFWDVLASLFWRSVDSLGSKVPSKVSERNDGRRSDIVVPLNVNDVPTLWSFLRRNDSKILAANFLASMFGDVWAMIAAMTSTGAENGSWYPDLNNKQKQKWKFHSISINRHFYCLSLCKQLPYGKQFWENLTKILKLKFCFQYNEPCLK